MSLGEKNTSEVLGTLQSRGDEYTKAAIIEKKRLEELEDALRHITVEIEKYRSKAKKSAIDVMNLHTLTPNPAYSRADGVDVEKQAKMVTNKVLHVLEMKLNKLLQKKSEVLNRNKLLKLDIDHMRRLRLQTDDSHAKFEAQLKSTKENIEVMLRESNDIVIRREDLLMEIDRLEKRNKEEQAVFEVEYEAMGKFIKEQNIALENALLKERKEEAHGSSLMKSMAEKPDASSSDTMGASQSRPGSSSNAFTSNLTLDAEIEMANKVGSLTKFVSNEQSSLANIQAKIASYDNMFEQLKKLTNANSLREVASTYAAQEEEMFSLYNYIQTVNTEIEAVSEDKQRIADEIETYKQQQQVDEIHRNKIIQELEQRYKATKDATAQAIEQNKIQQECVDQLSKKLQVIFSKLGCDQMDSKGGQQGGNSKGKNSNNNAGRVDNKITILTGQQVSESNVLDYMAAIEQRAVDIISEYLLTNQTDVGGNKYPTPGPTTPMRQGRIHIDVNESALVDEIDDVPQGNNAVLESSLLNQNVDPDSKPIDLASFKDRLWNKRKNNNSMSVSGPPSGYGTGGMGSPSGFGSPNSSHNHSRSNYGGHK